MLPAEACLQVWCVLKERRIQMAEAAILAATLRPRPNAKGSRDGDADSAADGWPELSVHGVCVCCH